MRDEKYVFISDCREKKSTAQSAFKRRTHTGKGGCKFPHEYLSKKELSKMNSETKSYRLNAPMSWAEFKAMPDDIKVMYIRLLREKFNVPDRRIAEMLDTHPGTLSREFKRLNLSAGLHSRGGSTHWDEESWGAWCGIASETKKAPAEAPTAEPETVEPEVTEDLERTSEPMEETRRVIPTHGNMILDGLAEDALETIRLLLAGANVRLHITWDTI